MSPIINRASPHFWKGWNSRSAIKNLRKILRLRCGIFSLVKIWIYLIHATLQRRELPEFDDATGEHERDRDDLHGREEDRPQIVQLKKGDLSEAEVTDIVKKDNQELESGLLFLKKMDDQKSIIQKFSRETDRWRQDHIQETGQKNCGRWGSRR